MPSLPWLLLFAAGVAAIVWGAETFAENLSAASVQLGVSRFALAFLLAGAEPEELATVVAAAWRGSPGIAFGDVIGANVAICLVALGVAAWIAPFALSGTARRHGLLGLPLAGVAVWCAWDGAVDRREGALLVVLYAVFVALVWRAERAIPDVGEAGEIAEARAALAEGRRIRVGRALLMVFAGVAAMTAGAPLLVAAAEHLAGGEASQTRLGLTLVGFATGFELVVLAWSAARRGQAGVVVAGVIGSYAYNVTMTLGVGALVRPIQLADAAALHPAWLAMLSAMAAPLLLSWCAGGRLGRPAAALLLAGYVGFVTLALSA